MDISGPDGGDLTTNTSSAATPPIRLRLHTLLGTDPSDGGLRAMGRSQGGAARRNAVRHCRPQTQPGMQTAGRAAAEAAQRNATVATYVHTSAMGVGLTSLGHLWAGRRRPHNNYVICNPADTTPIVNSAEHYAARAAGQRPLGGPQRNCSDATIPGPAGRRPNRTNQDCGPQGGAAEELLGNYAISARRLQTSMGELQAK